MSLLFNQKARTSFRIATREIFANSNFSKLIFTGLIWMGIYNAISPFIDLYLRDIGVSYFRISLLDLINSLIIIPSVLVGSYLSDLFPHRRSRLTGADLICWGVMCIVCSFATGFWSAMVAYAIAGISSTFRVPARAYMLNQSPQDNRFTATGFFSLYRLPMVLIFCFLLMVFRVYGFIRGMRISLFIGGSIIGIMGLVRVFFLTDPPKNMHNLRKKTNLSALVKDTGSTLRHLTIVAPAFVIVTFLDSFSDSLWSFLIYFILNEHSGLSASVILQGRLTIDLLSIPVILYLAFRINQNHGRKTFFSLYLVIPIAIGLLIFSFLYPYIPHISYVPFHSVAFIAYCLKYIQDFIWLILLAPVAMRLAPKEHETKAIGISWLLINLAKLLGSPLAGFVYQNYTNGAITLLGGILVLNVLILFTIAAFDCDFMRDSSPNESKPYSE